MTKTLKIMKKYFKNVNLNDMKSLVTSAKKVTNCKFELQKVTKQCKKVPF